LGERPKAAPIEATTATGAQRQNQTKTLRKKKMQKTIENSRLPCQGLNSRPQ